MPLRGFLVSILPSPFNKGKLFHRKGAKIAKEYDSIRPSPFDEGKPLAVSVVVNGISFNPPLAWADFEKVGMSVISRIGDPSVPKRTGISLTADEPQIRKVIS
jgi:hypothetical protein